MSMSSMAQSLIADMRNIIAAAGENQGRITPSVYDTAQALRLYPFEFDVEPGLRWLLAQQQADGGWGNPAVPQARDIPTLAAMLALATHRSNFQNLDLIENAIEAGAIFLEQQHALWQKPLPEDLPTGAEMVLVALLDDAQTLGIDVWPEAYGALRTLGEQKRQHIASVEPDAGTAPTYTWETWGATAQTDILDGSGGVGHSPAATAAWLKIAKGKEGLAQERKVAQRYLNAASRATGVDVPGVMPTVWPIKRFEQTWVLYSLFATDLLSSKYFIDLTTLLASELVSAMKPRGIGMSDYFIADGDITSTATAVLFAAGWYIDTSRLQYFRNNGHFITYTGELQRSLTTTAHGVLALGMAGRDVEVPCQFLLSYQDADGCWRGDKWHSSWLYTTATVVAALICARRPEALRKTREAVLSAQHEDGGWGIKSKSTTSETAYALHILLMMDRVGLLNDPARAARDQGYRWLLNHYRSGKFESTAERLWIGKELYTPIRVDRANELSALLAITLSKERK